MSRFFVPSDSIFEDYIVIDGSDVNHIKNVLRHHVGDRLSVSASTGLEYQCEISEINDSYIKLNIISVNQSDTELGMRIVLFQGLPKKDKMELIIQKAVELGVTDIFPVINERTVVKLDEKKAGAKTERWNKISESAAKQSGRMVIPVVHEPISYKNALEKAEELDCILLPYENADGISYSAKCIEEAAGKSSVGIFIGPEGGFSRDEVDLAEKKGASIISLGKRILRTETAGLTMLSILMFEKEKKMDLGDN